LRIPALQILGFLFHLSHLSCPGRQTIFVCALYETPE
jgi:hypothetical protein